MVTHEVTVQYNGLISFLDDAVKTAMEEHGFEFMGSGMDLQNGIRDIQFVLRKSETE